MNAPFCHECYSPPILPIDLLLGLLIIAVIILAVWMIQHLFLKVTYIPTPPAVMDGMLKLADIKEYDHIVDLGAGDARFLIAAKRRYPHIIANGCEILLPVWLLGKVKIWRSGLPISLSCANLFSVSLADADVVFVYLWPSLMGKLEEKCVKELQQGARVISHAFRFPGKNPEQELKMDIEGRKHTLFLYRI